MSDRLDLFLFNCAFLFFWVMYPLLVCKSSWYMEEISPLSGVCEIFLFKLSFLFYNDFFFHFLLLCVFSFSVASGFCFLLRKLFISRLC